MTREMRKKQDQSQGVQDQGPQSGKLTAAWEESVLTQGWHLEGGRTRHLLASWEKWTE